MELKFEPQISDKTRKNYVHSEIKRQKKSKVKNVKMQGGVFNPNVDSFSIVVGSLIFCSTLACILLMNNPKTAMANEGPVTEIVTQEAYEIAKLDTLKVESFTDEVEEVVEEINELERLAKAEEYNIDLITVENAENEAVMTGFVSSDSSQAVYAGQELLDKYHYALYDTGGRRNDINEHLLAVLEETCARYGISPHLVLGVIMTESEGHANAKNRSSTATGFGQILKSTGKYVYEDLMGNAKGTYNHNMAFDPEINIRMTATYLGTLVQQRGSVHRALQNYRGKSNISSYVNKINSHIGKAGLSVSMF